MSWIEGVGNEVPVVLLVSVTLVIVCMVLAWKSTEVPEEPAPTIRLYRTAAALRLEPVAEESEGHADSDGHADSEGPADSGERVADEAAVVSNQSLPCDITRRGSVDSTNVEITDGEVDEPAPTESTDSDVPVESCDGLRRRQKEPGEAGARETIKIRLKFINDTEKIVNADPQQLLADFKKEHFRIELAAIKVIKLIFNGQVLNGDTSQLSQLGLQENCVVHCLVHSASSQPQPSTSGMAAAAASESNGNDANGTNEDNLAPSGTAASAGSPQVALDTLDVGGLLIPLLSFVLGVVWYCRITYAVYFTTAATVALVGLSGLFFVSVLVICFPNGHDGLL